MAEASPANWYPDPSTRFPLRYWDGQQWTAYVFDGSRQFLDPLLPRRSSLLTAQSLVFEQRIKLHGSNVEFVIAEPSGSRIGTVREVGRGMLDRLGDRLSGQGDGYRHYRLELVDADGVVQCSLVRPKSPFKSNLTVQDHSGEEIGQINQTNLGFASSAIGAAQRLLSRIPGSMEESLKGLDGKFGLQFGIASAGRDVGRVKADDHRQWDFTVEAVAGERIATITKQYAGMLKESISNADHYLLQFDREPDSRFRLLVIASVIAVDLAVKQDDPESDLDSY